MKTVKLKFPIALNGKQVNSLTIRRPTVRDRLVVEHIQGGDTQKEITLISNLCELAPEDIEQLDLSDYLSLQEALNDFLS